MALDEPQDDDETFASNGVSFVINKELFEQVKPVKVDCVQTTMGPRFSIDSKLSREKSANCGSCSC
ncbi:MAG TPA: hypothetical protein PLG17_07970 [Thermodesulfobacteriota bacterium]|nr:hypothetical protein [Thermodesulfobacteriota bacterium]HNU72348.1 hypothetical protein [Thermodesulfobacteriota bacterium]HQO78435.1 hypothetical protein [Thermodesulfobacteriota bacterium]